MRVLLIALLAAISYAQTDADFGGEPEEAIAMWEVSHRKGLESKSFFALCSGKADCTNRGVQSAKDCGNLVHEHHYEGQCLSFFVVDSDEDTCICMCLSENGDDPLPEKYIAYSSTTCGKPDLPRGGFLKGAPVNDNDRFPHGEYEVDCHGSLEYQGQPMICDRITDTWLLPHGTCKFVGDCWVLLAMPITCLLLLLGCCFLIMKTDTNFWNDLLYGEPVAGHSWKQYWKDTSTRQKFLRLVKVLHSLLSIEYTVASWSWTGVCIGLAFGFVSGLCIAMTCVRWWLDFIGFKNGLDHAARFRTSIYVDFCYSSGLFNKILIISYILRNDAGTGGAILNLIFTLTMFFVKIMMYAHALTTLCQCSESPDSLQDSQAESATEDQNQTLGGGIVETFTSWGTRLLHGSSNEPEADPELGDSSFTVNSERRDSLVSLILSNFWNWKGSRSDQEIPTPQSNGLDTDVSPRTDLLNEILPVVANNFVEELATDILESC